MARFEDAIEKTLAHEGGYVNDPADPGGETKYGISKRSYPTEDIANLTLARAKEIYKRDFWRYDDVISQGVAGKVFDMAVNMGPTQAVKIVQRALQDKVAGPIVVDGKWGPQTLGAVNALDGEELLQEIRARQAFYYAELALNKPTMRRFLFGWLRRAVS